MYNQPPTVKEEKVETEQVTPVSRSAPVTPTVESGTEVTVYYNVIEREASFSDQVLQVVSESTPAASEPVEGQVVGEVTEAAPEPAPEPTPESRPDDEPAPPAPEVSQVCMNCPICNVLVAARFLIVSTLKISFSFLCFGFPGHSSSSSREEAKTLQVQQTN